MEILMGLAVIVMLAGGIFYNKLRAKYYGIIGVGGSYFAAIGVMGAFMLIGSLLAGEFTVGVSPVEAIMTLIFMLAGLGYLVYVMIVRCKTVAQRVFLPLVAVMIAFGFCWRLLLSIVFKVPMSNGAPESAAKFPARLTDDQGETWELQHDSGDHADYRCRKNGNTVTIWYTGDYVNLPAGWRAN